MHQRALGGFEKAWGPEHTSTLGTVNDGGEEGSAGTRRKESHALHYSTCVKRLILSYQMSQMRSNQVEWYIW